jgi:hypothetical protein
MLPVLWQWQGKQAGEQGNTGISAAMGSPIRQIHLELASKDKIGCPRNTQFGNSGLPPAAPRLAVTVICKCLRYLFTEVMNTQQIVVSLSMSF